VLRNGDYIYNKHLTQMRVYSTQFPLNLVLVREGVDGRMKRAIFVFAAALLVLLSYPSTQSLAASQHSDLSGPSVITSAKDGDIIPLTGDDDDGDADDITGLKNRNGTEVDSGLKSIGTGGFRTIVRLWWNYLIFFR